MGGNVYPVRADIANNGATIEDSQGKDITGLFQTGSLGSLLQTRNTFLPGLQSDLDRLAQSVADSVNTTLAAGVDQTGATPTTPLFTYDAAVGAARTLAVNNLQTSDLALALPAAPGGNGNALALAGLSNQKSLDGATFTEFYGNVAARVGREVSTSTEESKVHQSLTDQARSLRDGLSKVSLDEEAVLLIEYQRGFQATAKLIGTLDSMTDTLMGLIK